jgi:hypothetical protein
MAMKKKTIAILNIEQLFYIVKILVGKKTPIIDVWILQLHDVLLQILFRDSHCFALQSCKQRQIAS